MDRRTLLKTSLAAGAGLILPGMTRANTKRYPERPVKVIVPFAPGGSTDVTARALMPKFSEILGQNFIIDNRPGGGSNIGTDYAAKADPDGYTLFLGTIANAVNMSLYKNIGYNLLTSFEPISLLSTAPALLVINPKLPIKTVKEFIDFAKANPGFLNFASSGVGTTPHLAGEMLNQRYGVNTVHIPYKGAAPALADTISGMTHFGFKTALSAIPSVQAGQLRALAVASNERLELLPDVPTLAEAGVPDFEITSWNGLFAPAGTPASIIEQLNQACFKIAAMPDVQKAFAAQASVSLASTPEEFRKFIEKEINSWGALIKSVGVEQL